MSCLFCQNYDISTMKTENLAPGMQEFTPEEIIRFCEESGTRMIAFTYNEPTITYEFVYDTAKLAKEKGIKTVLVTNGFINIEPLKELAKYIDAANIDLKGFDEKFYREICGARLKPVLEAIKEYKKAKVWIELTNLLIPGKNDNPEKIEEMCKWIKENVGKETPLHFLRFFPMHKMTDVPQTEMKTLLEAKRIAKKYLDFVYVGNITDDELNSTFCPKCKKLIIERTGYSTKSLLDGDKCPFCKTKIAGVFER
ncbi:AmmeMemoRadiSam system radical SAM enzyme [Candidatus Woesearchaeota archaeon]|nr:MAG: AmmeMemoRadiSam system radical SAM enzyme [Candidatus Woesearchaeota archaeon]